VNLFETPCMNTVNNNSYAILMLVFALVPM